MKTYLTERYKNACSCPRCVSDIAAIALNYLPPHYCVDAETVKEFGSPWVMVEAAVVEAIDKVIENPNHPPRHQRHDAQPQGSPVLMG